MTPRTLALGFALALGIVACGGADPDDAPASEAEAALAASSAIAQAELGAFDRAKEKLGEAQGHARGARKAAADLRRAAARDAAFAQAAREANSAADSAQAAADRAEAVLYRLRARLH